MSLSNKSPKEEPQQSRDSILFPDSDEHQDLDDENEGEGHTHACAEAKNNDAAPEGEEGGHDADRWFAEENDASVAQCKSPTVIEVSCPVIAVAPSELMLLRAHVTTLENEMKDFKGSMFEMRSGKVRRMNREG